MPSSSRFIQIVFLSSVLAGFTACATSGGGSPGEAEPSGDAISIQVTNDFTPATSILVWVVTENGMRRRLGPVQPNRQRTFNYEPQDRSQRISLLATPEGPTTGTMSQVRERSSIQFNLLGVTTVSWTVSRQNVQIGG